MATDERFEVIVVGAGASGLAAAPDRSPEGLKRRVAQAVEQCTNDPRAQNFSEMHLCDWRSAPFIESGPNTNFGPGALTGARGIFGRPEHDRIYLSGAEWSPWYTGYVEGALRSGGAVAEQVLTGAKELPKREGVAWGWAFAQAALLAALLSVVFLISRARTVFARLVQLLTAVSLRSVG